MRALIRLWACVIGVLALTLGGGELRAELPMPPKDIWHQVTHISPFFTRETANLRMAAIIQSDGRFARVILGEDGQGAYVTVNLPGTEPYASLRSNLVMPSGLVLERDVSGDALSAQVMNTSNSVTYSFKIAEADIEGFKGARYWTLTPEGGAAIRITLKGSRKAITAAETTPRPLPAPEPRLDVAFDPRAAVMAYRATP